MSNNPSETDHVERLTALEAFERGLAKDPSVFDFFESLDRVNRAMHGTNDLAQMLHDVLDAVLSIFSCDRAFLLYPCDPSAASFGVPMERTAVEYPGAFELGMDVTITPPVAALFGALLGTDGTVELRLGHEIDPEAEPWKVFKIKSVLAMAVYPKTGKPWMFGVHQCAYGRLWSAREKQLFQEIGRRLSDSLTTLLMYRDLQESEELLKSVFENIPNMIFVKDVPTLRFVRFNKAGEKLLGVERKALLHRTNYDVFPARDAKRYTATDREVLRTKQLLDIPEETLTTRSGGQRILHITKVPILDETGAPRYLFGIAEDITERRRLEEQLHQAQKMESIGRLAGGVAHDFNNMLGVIIGNTDIALSQIDTTLPLYRRLQDIRYAAERSAELTRQLLAFARKQAVTPKLLDLNKTVPEMIKMLRILIGEHINLVWRSAPDAWKISIDPSQMDQILANLCVNARDAIRDAGEIIITMQNASFDEAHRTLDSPLLIGDFVVLSVTDNGSGMDDETLKNIFEPFFTTKGLGAGTGLGLATVYGIIQQNSGFIDVQSEPGVGTTFRLYLPRALDDRDGAHVEMPAPDVARGHETILLVEDEPVMLTMAGLMLGRFGYHVIPAARPNDALRVATDHKGPLHLIITDVIMPEMNGPTLAKLVATLFPHVRTLFMSGYMDDVIAHHGLLDEGINFIQKPFSMPAFGAKVRAVLDQPA